MNGSREDVDGPDGQMSVVFKLEMSSSREWVALEHQASPQLGVCSACWSSSAQAARWGPARLLDCSISACSCSARARSSTSLAETQRARVLHSCKHSAANGVALEDLTSLVSIQSSRKASVLGIIGLLADLASRFVLSEYLLAFPNTQRWLFSS